MLNKCSLCAKFKSWKDLKGVTYQSEMEAWPLLWFECTACVPTEGEG